MNEAQTPRARWDRILLGLVLVLQAITLGLLVHVMREQAALRRQARVAQTQPIPAPRVVSAPVNLWAGDVFDDMERAMEDMSLFPDFSAFERWDQQWNAVPATPTMDVRDMGDRCLVLVSVPGATPADLAVTLEGHLLSVTASTRVRTPHGERSQTFARKIHVPSLVGDPEKAHAFLSNGVLQVVLPYATSTQVASRPSPRRLL